MCAGFLLMQAASRVHALYGDAAFNPEISGALSKFFSNRVRTSEDPPEISSSAVHPSSPNHRCLPQILAISRLGCFLSLRILIYQHNGLVLGGYASSGRRCCIITHASAVRAFEMPSTTCDAADITNST